MNGTILAGNGINAGIHRVAAGFRYSIEIPGVERICGTSEHLEAIKSVICAHAREVAARSKSAGNAETERAAARVFTWAREARL